MPNRAIKQISAVQITDCGRSIAFKIETQNGESLDVSFEPRTFTKLIEDFIKIGIEAARTRTKGKPLSIKAALPTTFSANELTALAVTESTDRKNMVLILRLFDFDLSFQVEKARLIELAASFVEMTKAFQADEKRKR